MLNSAKIPPPFRLAVFATKLICPSQFKVVLSTYIPPPYSAELPVNLRPIATDCAFFSFNSTTLLSFVTCSLTYLFRVLPLEKSPPSRLFVKRLFSMQVALLPVTTNPLPMLNNIMIMFPFKVKVLWCTSRDVFFVILECGVFTYKMVH